MPDTISRPSDADTDTVRAILDHHAQLARELETRTRAVLDAVRGGDATDPAARDLVAFLDGELLPHAAAEERTLYAAGRELPEGRLLVQAMTAEHRVLAERIGALREQQEPIALATGAATVNALFGVHVAKENEQLLPLLLDTHADLPALLHDTHHLLAQPAGHGEDAHDAHSGHTH